MIVTKMNWSQVKVKPSGKKKKLKVVLKSLKSVQTMKTAVKKATHAKTTNQMNTNTKAVSKKQLKSTPKAMVNIISPEYIILSSQFSHF